MFRNARLQYLQKMENSTGQKSVVEQIQDAVYTEPLTEDKLLEILNELAPIEMKLPLFPMSKEAQEQFDKAMKEWAENPSPLVWVPEKE